MFIFIIRNYTQHFSFSQTSTRVSMLDRATGHVFYYDFLIISFKLCLRWKMHLLSFARRVKGKTKDKKSKNRFDLKSNSNGFCVFFFSGIIVHQGKRRIHSGQWYFGSFDAPWSASDLGLICSKSKSKYHYVGKIVGWHHANSKILKIKTTLKYTK